MDRRAQLLALKPLGEDKEVPSGRGTVQIGEWRSFPEDAAERSKRFGELLQHPADAEECSLAEGLLYECSQQGASGCLLWEHPRRHRKKYTPGTRLKRSSSPIPALLEAGRRCGCPANG